MARKQATKAQTQVPVLQNLRPRITLGEIADAHGLREVTDHPTWRSVVVTSVRQDNRQVVGGTLFAALPGVRTHGARFALDALARGAVAVLTDEAGVAQVRAADSDSPARLGPDAPFLVPEDGGPLGPLLGPIAAQVLDDPAGRLTSYGVTGTNGKTTVAYMLDHILSSLERSTGLVGTVEIRMAGEAVPSALTTPQATDMQHLMARMVERGVTHLSMEASSHALAQDRVGGLTFTVAGFTNLTQDHLDFHDTFEEYFAAKKRIFDARHSHRGVVLVDDAWGRRMYWETSAERPERIVPLAALLNEETAADEDSRAALEAATSRGWRVTDIAMEQGRDGVPRTAFTLRHADGRSLRSFTTLPSDFNVANAALALAMVLESGAPSQLEADHLAVVMDANGGVSPVVPGRMELVSDPTRNDQPRVIVDFAHNAGALESALSSLQDTTPGRLIVTFGAAGDRDAGKRPDMGRVAAVLADDVVITDDDPYGEDPAAIRAEVLAGAYEAQQDGSVRAETVREIAPREDAIETVILEAVPGDTVLIAGRGHETEQNFAGKLHPIDDRVVAREVLTRYTPHSRSTSA